MPKHISTLYDSSDTDIYQTDGYSGLDADINDTERFTDDIDLTMEKGAQVDFTFDGDNSTDDWYLSLYKRRNSSWSGAEMRWKSRITVSSDGSEDMYHYTIPENYEPGHYRFGMVSAGATTTFEMDVSVRMWRPTETIA